MRSLIGQVTEEFSDAPAVLFVFPFTLSIHFVLHEIDIAVANTHPPRLPVQNIVEIFGLKLYLLRLQRSMDWLRSSYTSQEEMDEEAQEAVLRHHGPKCD